MPPPTKHILLFFGVVLFLSAWHLFGGTNDNATSRAAMVASIVEHGTFNIDAYADHAGDVASIDGHTYSVKAPLPALLVVPFWWALRPLLHCEAVKAGELDPNLIRLGGLLMGSIPFALITTLIWASMYRMNSKGDLSIAWAAVLPLFGSFLFVQSGAFFGHLISALFLLLAFRAWDRDRHLTCGALSGCAVLCEYTAAIFPLCWGITALLGRDWSSLRGLLIGIFPVCGLLAAYNASISGSPFDLGYSNQVGYDYMHNAAGFGMPRLVPLWHITFSDYRGLFFYAPALMAALVALFAQGQAHRWWTDPIVLPSIITIVLMSGFGGWWGGWSYGPRYLTAPAVLLFYRSLPSVVSWKWTRWVFAPICLFGLLCVFAAKDTVGFSVPTEAMHPLVQVILPALNGSGSDSQWPVLLGVPATLASVLFLGSFIAALFVLRRIDGAIRPSAEGGMTGSGRAS